jgi:hypothetical protein
MSGGSGPSDAGSALWQTPELEQFADRVASILTEQPGLIALRRRVSEDLHRSVDLDQLTRQMSRDVAAGGNLSELQAELTQQLREKFAESPTLKRFRSELSSSLRLDPSFTESVRDLLGSRAMPVDRWTPLLQTLRQRTGVATDAVTEEMLSASTEVDADDSDETNWLLRLSGARRAALLLAATELAWALSQIAVIGAGYREASPQVQHGVQAVFALIAILVVLVTPDES